MTSLFTQYLKGYRKSAVFALTTMCNCKCSMCNMHKQSPKQIDGDSAKKILDHLYANKFLGVYFTGGEPTLHPDVVEIIRYSRNIGMFPVITTNGTASNSIVKEMKEAGLHVLSVSLDHWDGGVCEKIRNHKGIFKKQIDTITYAKKIGLKTFALAYLNPYVLQDGVEKLVSFANNELGVPLGFCYPTDSDINSYHLCALNQSKETLLKLKENMRILLYLKRKGHLITNSGTYIEDVLRFLDNKKPNFYCKGGEDVIYIDWFGDVYPCFLKEKMFNILKDKTQFLENVSCNNCLINCFREPSLLPQVIHPKILIKEAQYSHSSGRTWL